MADDKDVSVTVGGAVDASLGAAAVGAKAQISDIAAAAKAAQAQVVQTNAAISTSYTQMAQASDAAARSVRAVGEAGGGGLGNFTKGAQEAGHAAEGFGLKTAAARRELIVLAHEAATGNWRRFAGSLLVMAERMDAMSLILSPVGIGLIAVGAAVAVVTVGMIKGAEEWRSYRGEIQATANFAGVTASDFVTMSETIAAQSKIGIGAARKELTQLIGTGKFSGDTLRLIGDDAAIMARMTGEGADKFISEFAKMGDDVAKFAVDYSNHYHQITLAQYEHIRALQETGDVEAAQKALAQDVYNYLGTQAPKQLGNLENAWKGVTNAIGGAWEKLKAWGREKAPIEQLREVNDEIAAQKRATSQDGIYDSGAMDELNARKKALEATIATQAKAADAQHKTAAANSEAIDSYAKLRDQWEQNKTSGEKLLKTIADINVERERALKGANTTGEKADINRIADANIANARKSLTPKTPGVASAFSDDQAQLEKALVDEGNWYAERAKFEEDFWAKKLVGLQKGTTLYNSVYGAYQKARMAVEKGSYADLLAADKEKIAESANDPKALAASWAQYFADLSKHYSVDATEYLAAMAEKARADKAEATRERASLEEEINLQARASIARNNTGGANTDRGLGDKAHEVKDQGDSGIISRRQELAETIKINQEIANNDEQTALANLIDQLTAYEKIEQLPGQNAEAIRKAQAQSLAAWQTYADQVQTINQKQADATAKAQADAAKRAQEAWRTNVASIVDTVGGGFLAMARGTGTFQQLQTKVAESIENTFASMVEKKVTNWIAGETAQIGATIAGNAARTAADQAGSSQSLLIGLETTLKKVTQNAATAASAAYSALAGIPIIGPALGAAAAAVTFTAVEAFGAMASAAGGYDIPTGVNPVTQLHQEEMVLPANLSNGFRNIIASQSFGGGSGGSSSGGRGSGGDTHNWAVQSLDPKGMKRLISDPRNIRAAAQAVSGKRG